VREGRVKTVEDVMEEAEDDKLEREEDGTWNGSYHLSVFAGPMQEGETLDEAVIRLFGAHRSVKWYRVATPEMLQRQGFEVGASNPEPYHYDVVLGETLNRQVIEAFEGCLGEERRNGLWQRRS
jgi:hypothetical protein